MDDDDLLVEWLPDDGEVRSDADSLVVVAMVRRGLVQTGLVQTLR